MRNEFQVHMLNETGIAKATQLGEIFSTALDAIEKLLDGDSQETKRCRALVVTKMQEASFFAKRGLAVSVANLKPD